MLEKLRCFKLKISKNETSHRSTLFMSHKLNRWCKKTGIVLLFVFLVLFCLDGEAYVHCKSIFPDEIMDLHGNILSSLPEIEQPICSEIRNEYKSSYLIDRFLSCVLFTYKARICFPINNYYLVDSKERLFIFNRYNS